MSTTYEHVQLSAVNDNGDNTVIYPINTAKDVSVDASKNSAIPSNVKTLENVLEKLSETAFDADSNLVYMGDTTEFNGNIFTTEINDETTSSGLTWSSKKISETNIAFSPSYAVKSENINYLPTVATIFNVDGTQEDIADLCPEPDKKWIVEYIPFVDSRETVTGVPGEVNVVPYAIQKWTGIPTSGTALVQYTRVYTNGEWSEFTAVQ